MFNDYNDANVSFLYVESVFVKMVSNHPPLPQYWSVDQTEFHLIYNIIGNDNLMI